MTQVMLAQGYLAGTSLYSCIEHHKTVIDVYVDAIDPIFKTIRECEEGRDVMSLLQGQVCHGGFNRLN